MAFKGFGTRRQCVIIIIILVLSLFSVVTWYQVNDSLHPIRSSPADALSEEKAVLRESSVNNLTTTVNINNALHQHDSEPCTDHCTAIENAHEVLFRRESSFKVPIRIVNDNSTLYRYADESVAGNELIQANLANYNTSTENEIPTIDLDKSKPPTHVLYDKLTLVTSFSQNHFRNGLGFIGSAQQQMPNKTIIVYDLGLKKYAREKIRSFCNVQLRRFPFENYPAHVKRLHTYGFKPTIINHVLNEFGVIYYGDSSIRFKKPLLELLPDSVNHHGFLGQIRCFDPKVPRGSKYSCHHDFRLTKNAMYQKIGVNKKEYYKANFSSPAFSGGLMLVVNSTTVQSKIMKPWLNCALDVKCIAPPGASLRNHRFDQSALSIIAFKNMRGEWTLENDPTPHHNSVVSVMRRDRSAKWKPKSCS